MTQKAKKLGAHNRYNVQLLNDLIFLNYPLHGWVRSSSAGAITSANDTMQCGCCAIVVEEENVCYALALKRLQNLGRILDGQSKHTPYSTVMSQVVEYSFVHQCMKLLTITISTKEK